jgi:hypothetical protein
MAQEGERMAYTKTAAFLEKVVALEGIDTRLLQS